MIVEEKYFAEEICNVNEICFFFSWRQILKPTCVYQYSKTPPGFKPFKDHVTLFWVLGMLQGSR
jgi:hypothetical protein